MKEEDEVFRAINEKFFGDDGRALQLIAKIWLYCGIIGSIICAVGIGIDTRIGSYSYRYTKYTFNFWWFLITLLTGICSSVVFSAVLHGFGKMIEHQNRVHKSVDATALALIEHLKGDENSWICEACYTKNSKEKNYCSRCNCHHGLNYTSLQGIFR